MGKLTGKTALITGASKGIGEGIARVFAKHGANLVLAARGSETQALAQSLCESGAKAIAVKMDVSDMASVQVGYKAAVQAFGGVDILVSNAGICRLGDFLTQSDADRDAHLDINVKGAWNTCKAVLPGMVARKWGRVVIMSSVTGDMVADPGEAAYAMSKAALVGLTKALAREFAPYVNVNAICPGYVLTPMVQGMARQSCPENPQSVVDGIAASIPLGGPHGGGRAGGFSCQRRVKLPHRRPVCHRRRFHAAGDEHHGRMTRVFRAAPACKPGRSFLKTV